MQALMVASAFLQIQAIADKASGGSGEGGDGLATGRKLVHDAFVKAGLNETVRPTRPLGHFYSPPSGGRPRACADRRVAAAWEAHRDHKRGLAMSAGDGRLLPALRAFRWARVCSCARSIGRLRWAVGGERERWFARPNWQDAWALAQNVLPPSKAETLSYDQMATTAAALARKITLGDVASHTRLTDKNGKKVLPAPMIQPTR